MDLDSQQTVPPTLSVFIRRNVPLLLGVFLSAFLVLALGMTRRPNFYDESIVLTGAMRVMAGQLPHRDFYAYYGPAQFYVVGLLFKLFGPSLLIERIYDLILKSLSLTLIFALLQTYTSRAIAFFITSIALLWLFALNASAATPVVPVLLLNLVIAALLLPAFNAKPSSRRMFLTGVVTGLCTLFRYDTGIALLGIVACFLAFASLQQFEDTSSSLRSFTSTFLLCAAGFLVVLAPFAIYYLRHAQAADFIYDVITYPAKYYRRSRSLPFPQVTLKQIDNLAAYLPVAFVGITLYTLVARPSVSTKSPRPLADPVFRGFVILFAMLTGVMYLKAYVRISTIHLYLCTFPSLLLVGMLFHHRAAFSRVLRFALMCFVALSFLAGLRAALFEAREMYRLNSSVPGYLARIARHTAPAEETAWCNRPGPLTTGFCFEPEPFRIQTINYIRDHTAPHQPLYDGLYRHDIIFANDLLIYFAAQRMPATRWADFNPNVQNTAGIQAQMVEELDRIAPPLIVLDSELKTANEPNDSSKSSGVTILDEYLQRHYRGVQVFGPMEILERISPPNP